MICEPAAISPAELEAQLSEQIQRRTFGRVRDLKVDVTADRVVIHGWTSSYYVVQMVVLAVRDLLPTQPLQLDIRVGSGDMSRRGLVGIRD